MREDTDRSDPFVGVLLGTAVGDAFGLPFEGSLPVHFEKIPQRFSMPFMCGKGIVSDDTEQSALLAQSILKSEGDDASLLRHFRGALLGWFLRLPWGIGFATLCSCVRIMFGFRVTGSGPGSAGNGAAMRAAVIGVCFPMDKTRRISVGRAIAEVTHRDGRAVEGALFVAELAALLSRADKAADLYVFLGEAAEVVKDARLKDAISDAVTFAKKGCALVDIVEKLGNTGYVVHTIGSATFCLLRYRDDPMTALTQVVSAGGDADTAAAVLGAWFGAWQGVSWVPDMLYDCLPGGPFGRGHLIALGHALRKGSSGKDVPRYSWVCATARNLAMYPLVVASGVRHLVKKALLRR